MDNWLLNEVLLEQRRIALDRVDGRLELEAADRGSGGLRRRFARALVRSGLCLDRRAGDLLIGPPAQTRRELTS